VFSGGLAAAYIATNIGRLKHINPRTLEVFLATDQTIRSLVFTDAPDGYSGARRRGMTLRFGLVFDRVDTDGSPNKLLEIPTDQAVPTLSSITAGRLLDRIVTEKIVVVLAADFSNHLLRFKAAAA
jgi:hypothetical protein